MILPFLCIFLTFGLASRYAVHFVRYIWEWHVRADVMKWYMCKLIYVHGGLVPLVSCQGSWHKHLVCSDNNKLKISLRSTFFYMTISYRCIQWLIGPERWGSNFKSILTLWTFILNSFINKLINIGLGNGLVPSDNKLLCELPRAMVSLACNGLMEYVGRRNRIEHSFLWYWKETFFTWLNINDHSYLKTNTNTSIKFKSRIW